MSAVKENLFTCSVQVVDTFLAPRKDIRQGLRILVGKPPRLSLGSQIKIPLSLGGFLFFLCGHKSLSIIIRYALILLSVCDPDSLVNIAPSSARART